MSPELIDHFSNPRNVGDLPTPAVTVEVSNPICGDILRLAVLMHGGTMDTGTVAEARYKARGCTASIAAGSALTELLIGRDKAALRLLTREHVENALGGLSNESKHVAVLCLDAVTAILKTLS